MLMFFTTVALSISFAQGAPLKSYNIDLHKITVSGVSSGAFFAAQLQVAYSQTFSSAGIVAGGIYGCAEGQVSKAAECMKHPERIDSQKFVDAARKLGMQQEIDDVTNLKKRSVLIFSGGKDRVVHPDNAMKLKEFYDALNVQSNVVSSSEAAHGFPTLSVGVACDKGGLPWLLNCKYDLAGEMLKYFYGSLNLPTDGQTRGLVTFDQSIYADPKAQLLAEAWAYIPTTCANGQKCKLHVALHGCQMSSEFIQDRFVREAGYNRWAESNGVVVLYPQVSKRGNPLGCWDWTGYTGPNYATREGLQMRAVKNMVDALVGK